MKTKIWIAILVVGVACLPGNAQLKIFGIGPYAEAALPAGHLQQTNANGLGAGLGIDIRLSRFALTGSAGFMHFGGKKVNVTEGTAKTTTINVIPIRAGFKYYYARLFYFKLEGGAANYPDGDNSAFILSPGIGLRFPGLDIQAKYETWIKNGSNSFWGIKAGYNF
ncbi:MAG: hypothetical protein Q8941_10600 [Bacteroidota bacterium]|nr:hypothetical protein [Bacteroidota bacterium]